MVGVVATALENTPVLADIRRCAAIHNRVWQENAARVHAVSSSVQQITTGKQYRFGMQ